MTYEYKVVPAPTKGEKIRGVKSAADRFALTLSAAMNEMAADGWEYQRTDTLPAEERSGLTGKTTVFQNMLVFRRALEAAAPTETVTQAPAETAETTAPHEQDAPTVRVQDIAATHAPKLPSAKDAQTSGEHTAAPVFSTERSGAATQ